MKKITLILLALVLSTSTWAQIANNDCKKTCEVEKVVQQGTLLGVKITKYQCGETGVRIMSVLENTAAEKFKLAVNDIITYVDGKEILHQKQMVDLIASYKPSDLVTITYKRNGSEYSKDIVLGAKSTKIVKETICCDKEDRFFNDLNVSVYPNPAVSEINFSMNEAEAGKYTFQLFNVAGKEVLVDVENVEAGFSKKLDLSKISSGSYFLKITKGRNTITKSILIAK